MPLGIERNGRFPGHLGDELPAAAACGGHTVLGGRQNQDSRVMPHAASPHEASRHIAIEFPKKPGAPCDSNVRLPGGVQFAGFGDERSPLRAAG